MFTSVIKAVCHDMTQYRKPCWVANRRLVDDSYKKRMGNWKGDCKFPETLTAMFDITRCTLCSVELCRLSLCIKTGVLTLFNIVPVSGVLRETHTGPENWLRRLRRAALEFELYWVWKKDKFRLFCIILQLFFFFFFSVYSEQEISDSWDHHFLCHYRQMCFMVLIYARGSQTFITGLSRLF